MNFFISFIIFNYLKRYIFVDGVSFLLRDLWEFNLFRTFDVLAISLDFSAIAASDVILYMTPCSLLLGGFFQQRLCHVIECCF